MDEMKEIVVCRECHKEEYYGMMVWHNGHSYCRRCTYNRWRKQSNYDWMPGKNHYTFPLYDDGIDYTKRKVNKICM